MAPTAVPRGRHPDSRTRAPAHTRGDPPIRLSPAEVVSAAQESSEVGTSSRKRILDPSRCSRIL